MRPIPKVLQVPGIENWVVKAVLASARKLGWEASRWGARGVRTILFRVMPDEEDASRFIIARRDPETGEVGPALRRGSKRYVERAKDGRWRAL